MCHIMLAMGNRKRIELTVCGRPVQHVVLDVFGLGGSSRVHFGRYLSLAAVPGWQTPTDALTSSFSSGSHFFTFVSA